MGTPVPQDDLPALPKGNVAVPPEDMPSAPAAVPEGPKAGEWVSAAVRPVAQGVLGAVTFIPDVATDIVNMVPESVLGPKTKKPSDYWEHILDKYTQKPTGLGKAAEFVSSSLTGAGAAGALKKGLGVAEQASKKVLSRINTRTAEQAHVAGYKLPPSYIGGGASRTAQSLTGEAKLNKDISAHNEDVTDRLAKVELGLHPENELSPETFEALKTEAYTPYEQVRKLGMMPADAEYTRAIQDAGGRFASRGKSFGGSRYPEVDQEKIPYLQQHFDSSEAIDEIRMLRKLSRDNLKVYSPSANAVGYTQRQIADALEARLDRFAKEQGHADLIDQMRAARVQLSKIAAVEDSIGAGGHIRAADLKRMLDKGMPLSGNLKVIAETARDYTKAVQHIAEQGKTGLWSAVDYLLGGTGLLEGAPAVAGLSLLRPVSRWALKTGPVQNSMMRRVARGGAAGPASQMLGTAATGAGIQEYEDSQ